MKNLDGGLSTCAIFLDLAKAFDTVSHTILLRKLEKYGIRGNSLNLLKSYLNGRSQFVKINNSSSAYMEIEFGVPQGSILGPLLFLIYINDLPNASNFFIRLFADDTFLCAQNENIIKLENEVNSELQKVYNWLVSNKLTLNVSKSKFMIVSRKRQCSMTIKINDENLEKCDSYKYLGVYIDKDLCWRPHVNYLCKKISKVCGAISELRHCVGIDTLKTIYYALVNSYIRYGILIWGCASSAVLQPLSILNNRVLRIMTFAPLGRLDVSIMYDHLKILTLEKTYLFEAGKFIFKMKNSMLPLKSIATHFTRRSPPSHQYSTRSRSRNNLSVAPLALLSSFAQKSIQHKSAEMWSNIPNDVQESESYNIFKSFFKKYLLDT